MSKPRKYSLWVIPEGDAYRRLADLLAQMSKEYLTPMFKPHVTLLGQVVGLENEIVNKAAELATLLKPYEIRLTSIDHHDEYFRCLFVRVEETDEVMEANFKAREVFIRQQDPKYTPHLSLMYGNLSPETKRSILAKIGKDLNINFEAKSIHLFSTTGEVKAWYQVKELSLL